MSESDVLAMILYSVGLLPFVHLTVEYVFGGKEAAEIQKLREWCYLNQTYDKRKGLLEDNDE